MIFSGISVINWQQLLWQRTTLLTDKAFQFATGKTYAFSDSVLCMGGISSNPVNAWKGKFDLTGLRIHVNTKNWIESTGSRWSSSGQFSMIHHIAVRKRKQRNLCCEFSYGCRLCSKIRAWTLVVSWVGLGQKRSGTEITYTNQMENGMMSLILWWLISVKADIFFFRGSSAFERGDLKNKGEGK